MNKCYYRETKKPEPIPFMGKVRKIKVRRPKKGSKIQAVYLPDDWYEWNHPLILGLTEIITASETRDERFRMAIRSLRQAGIEIDLH